jgi:hypothetical protein
MGRRDQRSVRRLLGAAVAMPVAALFLVPAAYGRLRIVLVLGAFAVAMRFITSACAPSPCKLYGGMPSSCSALTLARQPLQATLELITYGLFSIRRGRCTSRWSTIGRAEHRHRSQSALSGWHCVVIGSWIVRGRILACLAIAAAVYGVIATGRWMFTRDVVFASTAVTTILARRR